VFGGHTKEAYDRAARLARGWFGFALDHDAAAKSIEGLREPCRKTGRKFEDLEISVTPRGKVDLDSAKRFAALGVHRLILLHRARDEQGLLAFVSEVGRDLIGKV
jgi:alkanesulfonate monooxygenase SsuD/methylene tetrahydromethanopterin reductase-like flavin-dependent oxidoreductase (luciferase family)